MGPDQMGARREAATLPSSSWSTNKASRGGFALHYGKIVQVKLHLLMACKPSQLRRRAISAINVIGDKVLDFFAAAPGGEAAATINPK
jgi:hypothetical protein